VLLLAAFSLIVLLVPSRCFAMMDIEEVNQSRAKELGMQLRFTMAGPDASRVELEFPAKGELASFGRVDMEIRDGKTWVWATLREERTANGQILVSFAANHADLNKITFRIVTQSAPREMSGYDIHVKDFIEPVKKG
jgi:hypothetical protein